MLYQLRKTVTENLNYSFLEGSAVPIQAIIVRNVFSTFFTIHNCHHHHKNLHKVLQMACQYIVEQCCMKVTCSWGWPADCLFPAHGEMKTKIERKLLWPFDIDAVF